MCLLIVLAQVHDELPLVVAANRDEFLERPALPMTVLRDSSPRVLGGLDEQAGGTWLAVNDHGVVAGLTNWPTPAGPDATKRSRGELPLTLAAHESAAAAVEAFASEVRPADYNPAWMLVADRTSAFAIDITGGDRALVERLAPGVHILENRALHARSPKVDRVRALVDGVEGLESAALVTRLKAALADHEVPPGLSAAAEAGREVPPEAGACCVHTEKYGTRWSAVITVGTKVGQAPSFEYAPGPPCTTPFVDAAALFTG